MVLIAAGSVENVQPLLADMDGGWNDDADYGRTIISKQQMKMKDECSCMDREQTVRFLVEAKVLGEGGDVSRSYIENELKRKKNTVEIVQQHFLSQKDYSTDHKFFNLLRQYSYLQRLDELLRLEEDGTKERSKGWLNEAEANAKEEGATKVLQVSRGAPESFRHPKSVGGRGSGKRGAMLVQRGQQFLEPSLSKSIRNTQLLLKTKRVRDNEVVEPILERQKALVDKFDSPRFSVPRTMNQNEDDDFAIISKSVQMSRKQTPKVQSSHFYGTPCGPLQTCPQNNKLLSNLKPVAKSRGLVSALNSTPRKSPKDGTEENPINLDSDEEGGGGEGEKLNWQSSIAATVKTRSQRATLPFASTASQRLAGGRFTYPPTKTSNLPQIVFTADDYSRISGPEEFLNDTIIDWYLLYVRYTLELKNPKAAKRCYFFNSFFYKKLSETSGGEVPPHAEASSQKTTAKEIQTLKNYFKIKNWTRDVDIFSKDYVFVPIHDHLHWSVVVICHPGAVLGGVEGFVQLEEEDKRIAPCPRPFFLHLDSLGQDGGHSNSCIAILKHYLYNEWRFKAADENAPADSVPRVWAAAACGETCGDTYDKSLRGFFNVCYRRPQVPRQDNHCDCGLFVCASVEYFVSRLPPSLNAEAVTVLQKNYAKDGIDLWEGSEEGFYPGFLTPHWYPPSNASALRWEMCHMALQGMAQAAGLLKDGDIWNVDAAPPGTETLLTGLMEEMEVIETKRKAARYLAPDQWLEKGVENKMKRMQARERREELERERKKHEELTQAELREKSAAAALKRRWDNLHREDGAQTSNLIPSTQIGIDLDVDVRDATEEVIVEKVTMEKPTEEKSSGEKMLVTSRKPRPLRMVPQHKVIESNSESSSVEVIPSNSTNNSNSNSNSSGESEEVEIGVVDGGTIDHVGSGVGMESLSGKKNRKKRRRLKKRSGSLGARTEHGVTMTGIHRKLAADLRMT